MKKFFSLLCAFAIVFSANALPTKKVQSLEQVKAEQVVKAGKIDASRSIDASSLRKAPKAASDYVVITEQPEGELKTYGRAGGHYYVSNQQLYYEDQSGTIDIVFGAENKVYFKDIVSGLEYGTWVEGTLSSTGDAVTVSLGQNLRYVADYDACIALQLLNYVSGSGFSVDSAATSIIFSYDAANDVFALQGTGLGSVSLAGVWTDDGSIQNYGDYASVYSLYEAPELVVLPEGATVVEYTMDYTDSKGDAGAKSINVAVVGDKVYFQGMSQYLSDAWVVGTKEGNSVTFAANQYVGDYGTYGSSYFFYSGEAVFTYDAEADKYSAEGQVFGVLAGKYYDGNYTNPVLTKAKEADLDNPTEVAITAILSHKYDSQYGDVIYQLGNAANDTIFQFDIYLDGELTDVELDTIYTLEDMEKSATYSYVQIGESKIGFKAASFVKSIEEGDVTRIEATVVDGANNVYHFVFAGVEEVPTLVVIPEGLETALYKFVGHDSYFDEDETKYIKIGFDNDTVYFQGLSNYLPEAWVKGTIGAEGAVALAPCYLGVYESFMGDYELYFEGGSMLYDATLDKFTADEFVTTDGDYAWDEYENVIITRFTEVAATPADPSFEDFNFADVTYPSVGFNIPLNGTEGEDLNPEKLSYIFFIQKGNEESPLVLTTDIYTQLDANMTEIPYNFTDNYDIYNNRLYLNQDEEEVRGWDKLGLQSIYRGGDEEHKSNIVWFDVKAYWAAVDGEEQGIEEVLAEGKAVKVIRDNQMIILKGDKAFNVIGIRVK